MGGDPHELVRTLVGSDLLLQVVIIAGKNTALRSELQELRLGSDRLRVEGFVDDVAGYLAACDVVVGKGGPASVYEALAVGRPVLVTSYAGLNERAVVRFLERQRLGRHAKTPEALLETIRRYLYDPSLPEEVALRCQMLDLEVKTERLAHYIVRYARAGSAPSACLRSE